MESRDPLANPATSKVVTIPGHMPIQKSVGKKSSGPMKSGAVYEGYRGHLACHAIP
jgi:hypothetical protein